MAGCPLPSPFFKSSHSTSILTTVPPALLVSLHLGSILKPSNHRPPSVSQLRLCACSNKSLDYTVLSFISLPHIPRTLFLPFLSFDAGSPSTTVTDLCLFSFQVLLPSCAPHRTHLLSHKDRALVTRCLCANVCMDAVYLCFHKRLSSLKSLSKLHSALTV